MYSSRAQQTLGCGAEDSFLEPQLKVDLDVTHSPAHPCEQVSINDDKMHHQPPPLCPALAALCTSTQAHTCWEGSPSAGPSVHGAVMGNRASLGWASPYNPSRPSCSSSARKVLVLLCQAGPWAPPIPRGVADASCAIAFCSFPWTLGAAHAWTGQGPGQSSRVKSQCLPGPWPCA